MHTEINNGIPYGALHGFQTTGSSHSASSAIESFGHIQWLDESGRVRQIWSVSSEYLTIGSGAGCSIALEGMGLELVHGSISFGKNHILIQAIEGAIRIAGRQIREWLIDEPTVAIFGVAKLKIVPAAYIQEETYASHRVTPGSIGDQAARLQKLSASALDSNTSTTENPLEDEEQNSLSSFVSTPDSKPDSLSTPPSDQSVQMHVVNEVSAALEPIRDSIDAIRSSVVDGLRELSTNLVDRYEQRFLETSAVIDYRFERIENLLTSSTAQQSPTLYGSETSDVDSDYSANPLPAAYPSHYQTSEDLDQQPPKDQYHPPYNDRLEEESVEVEVDQYLPESHSHDSFVESKFDSNVESNIDTPHSYLPEEVLPELTQYQTTDPDHLEEEPEQTELSSAPGVVNDSLQYEQLNLLYSKQQVEEWNLPQAEPLEDENQTYSDDSAALESELPAWFTLTQNTQVADQDSPETLASPEEEFESTSSYLQPVDYNFEEMSRPQDVSDYENELSRYRETDQLSNLPKEETSYGAEAFLEEPGIQDRDQTNNEYDDYSRVYEPERQPLDSSDSTQSSEMSYSSEEAFHQTSNPGGYSISEAYEPEKAYEYDDAPAEELAVGIAGNSVEEEEESIEVYMQRLLQRVKGEGTSSSSTNVSTSAPKVLRSEPTGLNSNSVLRTEVDSSSRATNPSDPPSISKSSTQIKSRAYSGDTEDVAIAAPPTTKVTRNVPRVSVEQQQESLAALRELANHTARRAINHNTKKRIQSFFYGKLSISAAGFLGGTLLLIINGITPNVAMAGMICAYAVFLLWGYDAWLHSRRLLATNQEDEVEKE